MKPIKTEKKLVATKDKLTEVQILHEHAVSKLTTAE